MMIGTAIAARPARSSGFKNDMLKAKHQAPITKHQRSTNTQTPTRWDLVIGYSLVLGYWCLGISFRARSRPECQIPAQHLVHRLSGIREHVVTIVLLGASF